MNIFRTLIFILSASVALAQSTIMYPRTVNTASDLFNLPIPPVGNTIPQSALLLGTDAPGDGGVGLLWWNYEETTAADGIDYFGNANPAFNTTGRWIRLPFALTNMITGGGGGGGSTNLTSTYPITITSGTTVGMSITNGLVFLPESTQSAPSSGIKISSIQPGGAGRDLATLKEPNGYSSFIGFQQRMFVKNLTGSTITAGQVVYYSGDDANTPGVTSPIPTVALAIATNFVMSTVAGIAAETMASGGGGYIVTSGLMNFNTSSLATNLTYYVHTSTPGGMTATRPTAGNQFMTPIGRAVSIGSGGRFLVDITFPSLGSSLNTPAADRLWIFGSGVDGNATITTPLVLTRDMYYTSLTMFTGGSIDTANYRIFVTGTLNLVNAETRAIFNSGNAGGHAGVSSTAGIAAAADTAATLYNATASTAGGNGSATTGAQAPVSVAGLGTGGAGGASGAGGLGTVGNPGGASRAGGTTDNIQPIHRATVDMLQGASLQAAGAHGGGGGGGGGNASSGIGGGGGGAGGSAGVLWVAARIIARGSNPNIEVFYNAGGRGGDGGQVGAGGSNGGGGGGGGGGAGQVRIHYEVLTGGPVTDWIGSTGGRGGNGGAGFTSGIGGDGGSGGESGFIWVFDLLGGTVTYQAGKTAGSVGNAGAGLVGGSGGGGGINRMTL